MQKMKTECDTF